jgi:hypothetical protein
MTLENAIALFLIVIPLCTSIRAVWLFHPNADGLVLARGS